ncbi:MAG: leucine-rich repeat domain-containing protein [Anaerolineaceae bacterium]
MRTTPPTPDVELTPAPSLVATSAPIIVTFADPVLEAMIRGSMGKPEGDITLTEAQAVTRMSLSNDWQRTISVETPIKDLSGLENFTKLETLDLSYHAVPDISPLQGLTSLTSLSLAGNPVADVSPLAGLTRLRLLILSGSQAPDYSALANLVNLQVLLLDDSTISDLAPLAELTNLRQLYLANTSVEDLSPLEGIYPNLEQKDFTIAATLKELGFSLDGNSHQAFYESEEASFTIHHAAWGPPPFEWDENIIRTSMVLQGDTKLSVGYYGVHKVYVCQMFRDGEQLLNYIFDPNAGGDIMDPANRPSVEQAIRTAMDVLEGEDPLLAPVRIFNETLKNSFNMTPEKLFALPYEPPTLRSLGFFADQANAVYLFEQRGEREVNIEVHRPEWGEKDFDVRFFTPLSEEYRIVITYHVAEKKFGVGADDNEQGGAEFEFYLDTGEFVDEWCSDPDMTVEEYFIKAYNDPAIEDVYQHSVDLMVQYIRDTFGMTIEELYALPAGE